VPREAERTPLLASGHGAERLAELLRPLGAPVVVLDQPAGAAARMKLLRSVFTKGLATLMIETLGAARAAGAEDWVRGQIASELGDQGPALLDRFVAGTYQHAERREHEVRDVLAALEATEQPSDMTRGTLAWFQRILAEPPA
jgi:3-hydroxyisobutyrate dehydrogenase-like beta-hydroxyacid dehydrogenase